MKSQEVYTKFWEVFDELLIENGEPFNLTHFYSGRETSWACVNSNRARRSISLEASITGNCSKLRVDLYIENKEINKFLYNKLLSNYDLIRQEAQASLEWENGTKSKKTIRLAYYVPINRYNVDTYRDTIERVLPVYVKLIKTLKKLGVYGLFCDF